MSEPDPPGAHPTQPAGLDRRRRHRSGATSSSPPEKARCAVDNRTRFDRPYVDDGWRYPAGGLPRRRALWVTHAVSASTSRSGPFAGADGRGARSFRARRSWWGRRHRHPGFFPRHRYCGKCRPVEWVRVVGMGAEVVVLLHVELGRLPRRASRPKHPGFSGPHGWHTLSNLHVSNFSTYS